ncbi:MAG: type II secretion system F family protein [Pseudomonadota bacterium]
MFGIDQTTLIVIGLIAVCVFALGYGLLYQSIETQKKSEGRLNAMKVDKETKAKVRSKALDEKSRRKQREDALKNVDQQKKAGRSADTLTVAKKMEQAGMETTMKTFVTISVVLGVFTFLGLFLFAPFPLYVTAGMAFVVAWFLPRMVVNHKRNKRFKAFTLNFPGAIDIIVRGIKSGLPLNDCMRVIAQDSEEPVRSEFQKMLEATQMGISVPEACERLYKSIPTPDANFFAIVIAIQAQAGGNLSEALANLSNVLRERKKMADKIKAVSSEAKASAMIIGSLPFVVSILIFITTPDYLMPLFTTSGGNKTLIGCAISMGFGIFVMKKMINFKF